MVEHVRSVDGYFSRGGELADFWLSGLPVADACTGHVNSRVG